MGASGWEGRQPAAAKVSASGPSHRSSMATRRNAPARISPDDLTDLGGATIGETNVYAIWWGNRASFPADAMSGMDRFLSGFDGSGYLAVANQYVGQKARTTFVGHLLYESPSPNHSPATEEVVSKVCSVLADARQAPSSTALYLVFTDGFPEQADFCAWHDGGRCP